MTIELQIYRDYTHLYSEESPLGVFTDLPFRLNVGDMVSANAQADASTVKECIYHPLQKVLACYAILDKPTEPIEKEVD